MNITAAVLSGGHGLRILQQEEDDEKLARELNAAGEQLELAKLLGYGKNNDFKPLRKRRRRLPSK